MADAMILTVLEAHVESGHAAALKAAYEAAGNDPLPPGLVDSRLLRSRVDPTLWRIETLWASLESLERMRSSGTPKGVEIFRVAGAEPTLTILEVVRALAPGHGAA